MTHAIPGLLSDLTTLQNAAVATGNGASLNVGGYNGIIFDVTIATTATVTFEQQTDTAWTSIEVVNPATGAKSTTATATGTFVAPVFGYENVRARISAWTAGAVTVTARALPNAPGWSTVDVDATGSTFSGTITGGQAADGAAVSGNPVRIAGKDGSGNTQDVITDTTGNLVVVGSGTGAAVPSTAFYQGGNAITSLPTAATAGNLTGLSADKYGRQVVIPQTIRDLLGTQTTTISASTSETTIVTAAASVFNDLLLVVCSNTSATAVRIDFRDTTAGSVLFSVYVPAGDTRGFSVGGPAVPQTSVNTNWTAQSSASVTDLRIYALFAKNR